MTSYRIAACGLASLLALSGCDRLPSGKPIRPPPPSDEERFLSLYDDNCAACHGQGGKSGAAPPLNDGLFVEIVPDEVLQMTITYGREHTLMPAFGRAGGGDLTPHEVQTLVSGIRTYWGQKKPTFKALPPEYLAGDEKGKVKEGAAVFATACASCHGKDGQGTVNAGAINDPALLLLLSDQVLRRIIITGRPDLPIAMPNFQDGNGRDQNFRPLTNDDVTNLTALLVSWRERGAVANR